MTEGNPVGYPSIMGILERLHAAGPAGMFSKDLTLSFQLRERGLHATQIEVNTCLDKLRQAGRATHGSLEPSPYYHHSPAFRWRITPEGSAYFLAGGMHGTRAHGRAAREQAARKSREKAAQEMRAMELALARAGEVAAGCLGARNTAIKDLYALGLTQAFLGRLFGITRERTRQVLADINVSSCRCPRCRLRHLSHVHSSTR
jgi:hypothetical protein